MSYSQQLQDVNQLLLQSISHVHGAYRQAIELVLAKARADNPPEWSVVRLPLLASEAAGGDAEQAIPVAAAWRALHIAADMLDDVQDDLLVNRASSSHAVFTNIATGLIMVCQQILETLPHKVRHLVVPRFNNTVLQMASGQHLDLCCRTSLTMGDYEFVMGAKSGAFFSLALAAGALSGGATEVSAFEKAGMALGMLIQVSDDDAGLRHSLNESDLGLGAFSLPVQYGLSVLPDLEAVNLRALVQRASFDLEAARAARQILLDAGCDHFMLAQLLLYHRQLQTAIDELDTPSDTIGLKMWVNQLLRQLSLPLLNMQKAD